MNSDRIKVHGIYVVDDQYFVDFPSDGFEQNKSEMRPNYYAFQDNDGIYWMIPLSTKVENHMRKIKAFKKAHPKQKYILAVIGELAGWDRVFLVGNMFPIIPKYIKRTYDIDGAPLLLENEAVARDVQIAASRFLNMVSRGRLKPTVDIIAIKKLLIAQSKSAAHTISGDA